MHQSKRFAADVKGGLVRHSVFLETLQQLRKPEHMVNINDTSRYWSTASQGHFAQTGFLLERFQT